MAAPNGGQYINGGTSSSSGGGDFVNIMGWVGAAVQAGGVGVPPSASNNNISMAWWNNNGHGQTRNTTSGTLSHPHPAISQFSSGGNSTFLSTPNPIMENNNWSVLMATTPPSVGDPPSPFLSTASTTTNTINTSNTMSQIPPPLLPLIPGNLLQVAQSQQQPQQQQQAPVLLTTNYAQHRFDETFFSSRPPPPPPPRSSSSRKKEKNPPPPPLVPQQITSRRRKPTLRRRGRKRKPVDSSATISENPTTNNDHEAPVVVHPQPIESSSPGSTLVRNQWNLGENDFSSAAFDQGVSTTKTTVLISVSTNGCNGTTEKDYEGVTSTNVHETLDTITFDSKDAPDLNGQGLGPSKPPLELKETETVASIPAIQDGTNKSSSSVTIVDPIAGNHQATKSRKKLEIARAKLELAKKRKQALQANHERQGHNAPKTTSGGIQAALHRARQKLQGALKNREKALKGLSASSPSSLPVISGLSANLIIQNIPKSGPEDMVYFPNSKMPLDLGKKELEELIGDDDELVVEEHNSLAERRLQLQRELLALKERLEQKQKAAEIEAPSSPSSSKVEQISIGSNNNDNDNINNNNKPSLTKEELERRKEEVQAYMDLSYWKHFVSKQEHILSQVDEQVNENSKAILSCENEMEANATKLEELDEKILDLEMRDDSLSKMTSNSMKKLLNTRNELHMARAKAASK